MGWLDGWGSLQGLGCHPQLWSSNSLELRDGWLKCAMLLWPWDWKNLIWNRLTANRLYSVEHLICIDIWSMIGLKSCRKSLRQQISHKAIMDFFWLCEQFAQPICIIVANDSMKPYTSHLHDGPGSWPIAPFLYVVWNWRLPLRPVEAQSRRQVFQLVREVARWFLFQKSFCEFQVMWWCDDVMMWWDFCGFCGCLVDVCLDQPQWLEYISQRANQQLGVYFEWLPDMTRKQLDVEAHSPTARPPVRGLKREIGSAG